jgi:hypothetical protein
VASCGGLRNGHVSTLSRQQGDELRIVKRHAGTLGRVWTLGLTIVGTDTVITQVRARKVTRSGLRLARQPRLPAAARDLVHDPRS